MPELIDVEPGSPEWLAARRLGVTATDIVTIIGLSAWDSVYGLFWKKLGQVPDEPERDRWELGKALEPYITERWANTGSNWKDFVRWPGGLYRHSGRTWQMATPDRILGPFNDLSPEISPPAGVLELKSWADVDRKRWEDGPPAVVRAQVLWQMDVMDVSIGHVGVVFLPSGDYRSYTIEHKESPVREYPHDIPGPLASSICRACADIELMRAAGEEFMARLRVDLPPPDPDSSAATLAAVRARFTRQPDKQVEIDPYLWIDFEEFSEDLKYAEVQKRAVEIKIREQAGEAQVLCVDGEPVARRIVSDAKVKAHTRHMDYLRRITPKEDDDE